MCAVSRLQPRWLDDKYALLAALDSCFDLSELIFLSDMLEELDAAWEVRGRNVVIDGATLVRLLSIEGVFNGFDEVWLFQEVPAEPRPEVGRLTSDKMLEQRPPSAWITWLRQNGGIAGLGDGIGLNWITFDPSLAVLWSGD